MTIHVRRNREGGECSSVGGRGGADDRVLCMVVMVGLDGWTDRVSLELGADLARGGGSGMRLSVGSMFLMLYYAMIHRLHRVKRVWNR